MKRVNGFLCRQYACVLRRCAWNNALHAFFGVASMVSTGTALADSITPDGRTQTQLSVNGAVTDITTKTVQGVNALNSFHRFNIGNGQTVNMYLPAGTSNLLNLVHDERSYFDGVLNAYKDGRIGGNVFFLNPYGMVVGSSGVLNVGSLNMSTPSSQFMDHLLSPAGLINDGILSSAVGGQIPLTDSGLILVKGRINATSEINLSAGKVEVAATGRLLAGQKASAMFADLVNLQGVESASAVQIQNGVVKIVASSSVDIAGKISVDGVVGKKSGLIDIHGGTDINIASGAVITASGEGLSSSGGHIKVFADGDATLNTGALIAANAGATGDGGFVEFSAKNTVNILGGQLEAGTQNGLAGTVLIDPNEVLWTGAGHDVFSVGTNYEIEAKKRIILDDVTISTRNVAGTDNNRANILNASSIGNSGNITLKSTEITLQNGTQLLAQADGTWTGGKVTLEARDSSVLPTLGWATATTKIDINNATIKANEIVVDAKSNIDSQFVYSSEDSLDSTLNVATATGQQIGGFLASLLGVQVVVSNVTAKAYVNVTNGSILEANSSVSLTAENVTKAGLAKKLPSPGVQFNTPVGIGALWVSDQSDAKVTIGTGATIKSGDLNISAHNNASLEGSIASANNQSANSDFTAIAFGITKANVQATAMVESGANILVSGNLTVAATNVGSYSNEVTSKTGPNGRAAAAIAYADHQSGVSANLNASVGDATKVQVVAINDVLKDQAIAISKVGGSEVDSVVATGKRKVSAAVGAEDFFWNKLGLSVLKPDNKSSPTQQSFRIGGAIAYDTSTHTAFAGIGESAKVHVTDSVAVVSRIRAEDMKIAAQAAAVSTSSEKPQANDTARQAYSVGLAIGNYTHDAVSKIGSGVVITGPEIAVYSDTILPIRDSLLFGSKTATDSWSRWDGLENIMGALNSISNIADVFNGISSAKSSADNSSGSINLSGSVSILSYTDNSRALLEEGAELNISGNKTGSWGTSFELKPEVKHYDKVTGTILLSTDKAIVEDFNFSAPASIEAKHDATLLFQAGDSISSAENALGAALDLISVTSVTEAVIREGAVIRGIKESSSSQPLGSRVWTQTGEHASNELKVAAVSNERIISLAKTSGFGATFGANGTYSQIKLDNATHALVDDEASINAMKFSVNASASPVLWSLSGAINMSKGVSVGVGVAINEATGDIRAEIADNDKWSTDANSRTSQVSVLGAIKSSVLDVEAKTSGRLEAIAVTGALANNGGNPPGTPGIADKIKSAIGYTEALAAASDLVGLNKTDVKKPASSGEQEKEKKPTTFGLSGAGSGAVNVTDMYTVAKIDGVIIDQTGSADASLIVRGVSDSDITAAAGAAAITRANQRVSYGSGQSTSVAIAGSLALNSIGNGTEAWVKNSKISQVKDVTVQALSGGEQLAVAIGMALDATNNTSVKKSFSVVGSLSLTLAQTDDNGDSKNKTVAKIENSTITGEAGVIGRDVDVTAYNRTFIGTGGGSLAIKPTNSNASGASIGGAVSLANVRNDVMSGIHNSTLTAVDTIGVQAYNATEIGSGAAMGGYSGAEGVTSISASVVVNQITNNTTASIDHSTVTASGKVKVIATDNGADSALESIIDPSGSRANTAKGLDYCGDSAGATPGGNCIAAVAGTVQAGRGNNVGFSVAYNSIENNLTAQVKDSLVKVTDSANSNEIKVSAASNTSILGVAFGVGASTKMSGAGSVSMAEISNHIKAEVAQSATGGSATILTAPTVTISAMDRSTINTVAGQVNVSTQDSALGAAFAYNNINNEARAIAETVTIKAQNEVNITANEQAKITSLSAAAGLAKEVGASLSASLNYIKNTTEARLSNGSHIEDGNGGTNTVKIKTDDTSTIKSLAGSVGVGMSAGVGAAFSLNKINNTNSVLVDGTTIDGASTLELMAHEKATIWSVAAAVGAGQSGFSGSFTLNEIGQSTLGSSPNSTTAVLEKSTVRNGGGSIVTVQGKDESDIRSIAGSVAIGTGGVAVGAAVADNNIQSSATGKISQSTIQDSAFLTVNGSNNSTIKTLSAAGAGSDSAAFTGSASSNRTLNKTYAEIVDSEIKAQAGNMAVNAINTSTIDALSGSAAIAASMTGVAAGIAVSVNQINDTTEAHVSGKKPASNGYEVKNLKVAATSTSVMQSLSVGVGASGAGAGAGSIAINKIDSNTKAYIDNGAVVLAQHNVGVTAESNDKITVAAGSMGIGLAGAGVGVTFTVNSIKGDTSAYIDGPTTSVTALAKDSTDVMLVNSGALEAGVKLAEKLDLARNNGLDIKSKKLKESVTGVAVNASSTEQVENIGANIAGGAGVGVGVVSSINVIGGSTQAYVQNAKINNTNTGAGAGQQVAIKATNVAYANSFIGGVSVGGSAGGMGEDLHTISRTTTAYAKGGTIDAKSKVSVEALAKQGVSSIAVGAAVGGLAGVGTLSLTTFNNLTDAYIDSSKVSAMALDIKADNSNNMYLLSGAVAVGGNALGGAFAVGSSDSSTTATLKNANGANRLAVSGDVVVDANNSTDIHHIVVSGAGGGGNGIAGMADVNLVTDKTEAHIENSDLGTVAQKAATVLVNATHTLNIDSKAGALGVGITGGGIGAGASVNIVKARTAAIVKDSNIYTNGITEVTATSVKHVDATALTAGVGGTVGIGGAAVAILIGDDVKDESAAELNKGSNGTLATVNTFSSGDRFGALPTTGGPTTLSASDKADLNSATNKSTTAVAGSAGGYLFKTAAEVNGTSTINAGSLDVIATDKTDTKTLVGGLGLSLGGGIGGAVAVTSVKANVAANVSGTGLTTSGNVNVKATADKDVGKTIDVLAIAGGAGIVGIGAAVSYTDITNHVDANLASGANAGAGVVTVSAEDKTSINSNAKEEALGAAAAGVVVSHAAKNSTINASVGGVINAAAATISATDNGQVVAVGQSAAGGLVAAGSGAVVNATDDSTVKAVTASNTSFNLGSGTLIVTSTATPQTESKAFGVAVSGGVSIGASISQASANTTIEASLGSNNTVNAGGLTMTAQQLRNGGGESAKSESFAATGGLLFGGNATLSDAKATLNVDTRVGNNSTLNLGTGTATIKASVDSKQYAEASGVTLGVVAAGFNMANANSNNFINASLGSGVKVTAGKLDINSGGIDENFAKSTAGSGGVFSGAASVANTVTNSTTKAYIENSSSGRDINVGAVLITADHTSKFNSYVNSINASVVGASGAYAHNKIDKSVVWVGIGDNVNISADYIDINANNRISKQALSGFNVVSASGGLFDAAATHSDTTVNVVTDVAVGNHATLVAARTGIVNQGHMNINALNDVTLYDAAKMDSGGAIALAKAESFIYNDQNDANITVGSGTLLSSDNTITLETKTLALADTEVQAKTYGVAGAAQGETISRIGTSNNITLNGARIESDENVVLRAGYNNVLKADAETRLWNRTLVPMETSPDANGQITQSNRITINAYVPTTGTPTQGATSEEQISRAAIASVKDIYLQSGEGTHTTRGYGRGTDLYRELLANAAALFGINLSLDITGGSTSDNSVSGVVNNATMFAGTHFHQYLYIDANGNITKQSDGVTTPTVISGVSLARDIQVRIDVLQALYNEYKDDNPDIANGFMADIDTLNAKKARMGVGAVATFMYIDPIAAYTGNIITTGDTLAGLGELMAPGDARIEIINDANQFLKIKNVAGVENSLFISSDVGGKISLNGVRVSSNADINAINQSGVTSNLTNMLDRQTSPDPTILIKNTYQDPINTNALNPEVQVEGNISNILGLVKIDSTGSIQVSSDVVAKTIDIATKGDFIKTFTLGFSHLGGDPPSADGVTNWVAYYEQLALSQHPHSTSPGSFLWTLPLTTQYTDSRAVATSYGTTLAGNNVFISGERLNINGVIQSGMPLYDVTISDTIAQQARNANGGWINISQSIGGVALADSFLPKLRWNAALSTLELGNLKVDGGYMQLYGDIFSTGNGVLNVLDGYGRITVNNTTAYALQLNQLDTGAGVAGRIKITDTSTHIGPNGSALVTEIYRLNGNVTVSDNAVGGMAGRAQGIGTGGRTGTYNPLANRRFFWLDGQREDVTYYRRTTDESCLAINCGHSDSSDTSSTSSSITQRISGDWLATDARTDNYLLDYTKRKTSVTGGLTYDNTDNYVVYEKTTREWEYKWSEYSYFVNSLNASKGIKIQFIGDDVGSLSVTAANANINLAGYVRNLTGTTTLSAKSISAADTALIDAKDLNLTATAGSIGNASTQLGASSYLKTNLQAGGKLDATATGGIALWEQDGSLAIKRAAAAGVVNIMVDGDLLNAATGVAVSGSSVRLTSENGAIGSTATPMLVDTTSSTGNFSAAAAKSITITENTGDLRIDSVASLAGDVTLEVKDGSIIDDNSVFKVDIEARNALLAVADRAGLRGTAAADSEQNTISGYNQAKQQDYARYWQARNVHKNSSGSYVADAYDAGYSYHLSASQAVDLKANQGWSSIQVSQFEARQTALYHTANLEFGTQAFNSSYSYNVQTQDNATYQQLIAGSTWTDAQIANRVAAGIFKDTADTQVLIENANVTGKNITLIANAGGIGIEKSSKIISFVNPDNWNDDERLALAAADRKDVVIDYSGKTMTIRQKDDVNITLKNSGQLVATAGSDIYIGSEEDVRVKNITAPGTKDVRIKTGAALINVATTGAAVTGRDVTLEAGGGNLGSSATPFLANVAGNLTARAKGDLYVNNTMGNMRIEQVYATKLAKLVSVGAIVEDPLNHNFLTDIQATNISLTAATTIGESDPTGLKYLDMGSEKTGWVDMTAPDGIYVYSPSRVLNLRSVNTSSGEVAITTFASSLGVIGNINGRDGISLSAGEAILFDTKGLISSSNGNVNLTSAGYWLNVSSDPLVPVDLTHYGLKMDAGSYVSAAGMININVASSMIIAGQVNSGSSTNLNAGDELRLTGGSVIATGAIAMVAGTDGSGSLEIGEESSGGYAVDTDSTLSISAANDIKITGRIRAKTGATIEVGDDIKLTGGSLSSSGAISLIAGTDGTGSVDITAEAKGGNAIDIASNLTIIAANDINIIGQIHAQTGATLEAGDDIKMAGGSLDSNGAVHIYAGKDGTGSVNISPASGGGNVIYTSDSLLISAADDINIGGDLRADIGLDLSAGHATNITGGILSTGGKLNINSNETLTIGGYLFGGAGVALNTGNDVVFSNGSITSNHDVTIVAGTDGTGSIFGSANAGTDILALGALRLQAPDAIGAGSAIVSKVAGQATFLSKVINADIAVTPLNRPLNVYVSDIGGGPSANVNMHVSSDKVVTFNLFNVGIAHITADTPSLQVPNGQITNFAVFNMPNYSSRVDTFSRVAHPGYAANAFTLNGKFNLNALPNSISIGAYILNQNPNLRVDGTPLGMVVGTTESLLQTQKPGENGQDDEFLQSFIWSFTANQDSLNADDTPLVKINIDDLVSNLWQNQEENRKENEI